jgi:hypothetical protein
VSPFFSTSTTSVVFPVLRLSTQPKCTRRYVHVVAEEMDSRILQDVKQIDVDEAVADELERLKE